MSGTYHVLTEDEAPVAVAAAAAVLPPVPPDLSGRGIVIPAGGQRYFPGAWVCIRTLRDLGCRLPVELWHVGPDEVDDEMRLLIELLDVTCVDAEVVRRRHPATHVKGWPIKAYALQHSRFREVLLMDADNMPLANPEYLFDEPEYLRTGAVFWPDAGSIGPGRKIWRLTGVEYRPEPAVESGQLLVDKARCWPAVALATWMNCEHGDFWYRHVYGDKDTFHFAWRRLGMAYAMPDRAMEFLTATMIQHDFHGSPVFQHRHGNKWALDTQMLTIPGFRWEDRCRAYLDELRRRWSGHPARPYREDEADPATREVAASLIAGGWELKASSTLARVALLRDGRVAGGSDRERTWTLRHGVPYPVLSFSGVDSVAWMLLRGDDDTWLGRAPAEPRRKVELRRLEWEGAF